MSSCHHADKIPGRDRLCKLLQFLHREHDGFGFVFKKCGVCKITPVFHNHTGKITPGQDRDQLLRYVSAAEDIDMARANGCFQFPDHILPCRIFCGQIPEGYFDLSAADHPEIGNRIRVQCKMLLKAFLF